MAMRKLRRAIRQWLFAMDKAEQEELSRAMDRVRGRSNWGFRFAETDAQYPQVDSLRQREGHEGSAPRPR